MKTADLWLRVVALVVLALADADLAVAGDWACTQPPNAAIKKAIDQYPGPKHSISNDRRIVNLVENALEKRLGFKSDVVSCEGSSCRIGREFIRFIDGKVELPSGSIPMSICSAHNPNCVTATCAGMYSESDEVIYIWDVGVMGLDLEVARTKENQLHIDEFNENNLAYDPRDKELYSRLIGVSRNQRMLISIITYYYR